MKYTKKKTNIALRSRHTMQNNNKNIPNCNITNKNYCVDMFSAGHIGNFFSTDKNKCAKLMNTSSLEYKFYNAINSDSVLLKYMPKYHNICVLNDKTYIVLENLKRDMENPLSIDIKIGFKTTSSKILKIKQLTKKYKYIKKAKHFLLDIYTNTQKYGFRVEGASLSNKLPKKKLMAQNFFTTFDDYFSKDVNNNALNSFINKLLDFIKDIKNNQDFNRYFLIGVSILFIYDAQNPMKTKFNIIDLDNSIIIDDNKEIEKNKQHSQKNIIALENVLNILKKFRLQK